MSPEPYPKFGKGVVRYNSGDPEFLAEVDVVYGDQHQRAYLVGRDDYALSTHFGPIGGTHYVVEAEQGSGYFAEMMIHYYHLQGLDGERLPKPTNRVKD